MGIERYLCVGGNEVANPNRTLAYMRSLGNRCQPSPPGADCCECPDWAQACSVSIDIGTRATLTEVCSGIRELTGFNPHDTVVLLTVNEVDCPPTRPAVPDPDDPGWLLQFYGALEDFPSGEQCTPIGDVGVTFCGFARYTFLDPTTGAFIEVLAYVDFGSITPGDPGESAVSFDGGDTWTQGAARRTEPQVCPSQPGLRLTVQHIVGEFGPCWVFPTLLGGSGAATTTPSFFAQTDPAALPMPAPDDPGWANYTTGSTPPDVAAVFCESDAPSGWHRTVISDPGADRTVALSFRYDESAGTLEFSTDDGATWGPPPANGVLWIDAEPEPAAGFATPETDDAPWYDPAVSASADVLGVWIEEARLGTSFGRDVRPKLWGSSLGPVQAPGRELTIVGWCYTRSEAATAYARQWLFEALAGGCSEGCDLPDAEVWTHCNPDVPDEGRRVLKRVGLTSWDPDTDPTFPRACGFKFEVVLTSEVPHLVTAPFQVVDASLVAGDAICVLCSPCPEPDPQPITCGCMDTPLRVVPAPEVSSCYCPPVQAFRQYVRVVPPRYWSDALAVITVETGDPNVPGGPGLANLRIRGWVNPVGLEPVPGEPNPFECQEPCLDVEVGCVPPRSTLVIDAATRRATVTADGRTFGAYGYLSSGGQRFVWPEVSCHGLVLAIDADAGQTPEAATVRVEFVTRERG